MEMRIYLTSFLFLIILIGSCNLGRNNTAGETGDDLPVSKATPDAKNPDKLDPYCLSCSPTAFKLNGGDVRILEIALSAFRSESRIPPAKRELSNYEVEFREDGAKAMVSFLASRENPEIHVGGETKNAMDTTYVINKDTLTVAAVIQYK